MFYDTLGNNLTENGALVIMPRKDGKTTIAVWWRKVASKTLNVYDMNEAVAWMENRLEYKITKDGCKTISTMRQLVGSYFFRPVGEESIEICGAKEHPNGEDITLFRYVLNKSADDESAWEAWTTFNRVVEELTNTTLYRMFGGLPRELHQYRECVPPPINWVAPTFVDKVVDGCVKADICSAYGTEASKTLPDLHTNARKIVDGKVEPTEEYPFAFYLESGEMAIYGEGNSEDQKNTRYMKACVNWVDNERTLLCKAAKADLRPVFEFLYDNRKDNEFFKFVMNATIGMFHQRKFRGEESNLWPLAAVIKFRCNKRIIDYCDALVELGQAPLLINTDSITWFGTDTSLVQTEKKLGNFALEYTNCSLLYAGPKAYQIQAGDEVITRWSGPHRKEETKKLPFGALLDPDIKEKVKQMEKANTYIWSWTHHRYINKLGQPMTKGDYEND